jgi:hypothetical protein
MSMSCVPWRTPVRCCVYPLKTSDPHCGVDSRYSTLNCQGGLDGLSVPAAFPGSFGSSAEIFSKAAFTFRRTFMEQKRSSVRGPTPCGTTRHCSSFFSAKPFWKRAT